MKKQILAATAILGVGVAAPVLASEELVKKHACTACHAVDRKLVGPAYKDVAAKYKVGVLPTTFVIDREGRIRHTIIGEKTRAYFEARIAPLLDETTTAATARGVN